MPLAHAEYEQGHYTAAEATLRKVLAVHSKDPLILNNLGVVLVAEAKYAEAEPLPRHKPIFWGLEAVPSAIGERIDPRLAPIITRYSRQARLYLAKTSYTHKMNDLAPGLIRTVPIVFLP